MNGLQATTNPPLWRDRFGRALMWLSSLGAVVAFVQGVGAMRMAPPGTVWMETWRTFGFLVFAGMFALVALRPRRSAGVWELAFFHKAAMGISALFLSGADGAVGAGTVDAVLAVLLAVAYVCTRGWLSWRHPTPQ